VNYAAWADWYDVVYSTEGSGEVDFYVDLAKHSGGPVLEIGVGTGRIAIPTARAGIDIVGVDLSPEMLDVTRKRLEGRRFSSKLELIQADMRNLDLKRKFRLVTIPARALLLADNPDDQLATLRSARSHLARGGRLALNVFVPDPHMLGDESRSPFFWDEVTNPANGRRCLLWALNRFDTTAQTNDGLQIIEELDERGRVATKVYLDVRLRYLYPPELRLMLERCGLRILHELGDFSGSPFDEHSPEYVVICRTRFDHPGGAMTTSS
jgi:SAM-dependent methyltransferase